MKPSSSKMCGGGEGDHRCQPIVIRPGFDITARYTNHAGQVHQAIHNRKVDMFISTDSGTMHCWRFTGHVQARTVNTLRYPRGTQNFVTCMTYSDSAKLIFCACLDGNLRIYKNDLQLKSVLPWDQTVVYDMHFLRSTNEIIASGLKGVKIYSTEVDDDAYARSVKDPEDVLSHIAHETNVWAYGQCQKIKVRMELRVPGFSGHVKAAESDKDSRQPAKKLWVYEGSNLVCTSVGGSVYGFNFRSGKRILNCEKLHKQYISQFLLLPDRGQAITVCEAPTAIFWKLEGWKLQFVSKFGSFASVVVSLMRVPHHKAIITATKDGSVKMWSVDTLQPLLAMKATAGVSSFDFIDASRCLLTHGCTVRLLSLRHCFPVLLMCDSDVTSMRRCGKGSVFIWCEDDSAKLVDEAGLPLVLIPPQLAVHSAKQCAWCPASKSAFVLLQNYDVHVWRAEAGAVRLASVWKQHRRVKLQTIALMPVATIPENERSRIGIELAGDDVLVAGTEDGDIALLDPDEGVMQLCFCAHKLTPIIKVIADETKHRLLSVADCSAKVWNFKSGIKSFGNLSLSAIGTCACKIGSLFIVGTASGSVHMIDMISGLLTLTITTAIHSDYVTTLQPSASNRYVISSSKDGTVKVWNTSGKLIISVANTRRMQCACFLSNDDIVIASGRQVEVIKQPFDINSRSLDPEEELDSSEDQLPSFSKRALQLGLNGRTGHLGEPCKQQFDQVEARKGLPNWATDSGTSTQHRDACHHLIHGMKNLAMHEVSLLGGCNTTAVGEDWHTRDAHKGVILEAKMGPHLARTEGNMPAAISQQVLKNAESVLKAQPKPRARNSVPVTDVERALNPNLRKALRVFTDPTAFLEGQNSKALVLSGEKKKRKKRRKKKKGQSMNSLEKKAQDDSQVLAALRQIRVQDAWYQHTMRKLVPNQKILGIHTPAEAHE